MKKKVVALMLAGAMIFSQFMGSVELLAASTVSTESDETLSVVEEANRQSGGNSGTNPGNTAQVYAVLEADGKVFARNTTTNDPTSETEMTEDQINTITDLLIAKEVTEIPNQKFMDKATITKLTFEDAGTEGLPMIIGSEAFQATGITEIVLPDRLTEIKHSAFKRMVALTKIKFGSNLTTIGGGVFQGDTSLAELDLTEAESLTTMKSNAFKESNPVKLYIGESTKVFDKAEDDTNGIFSEMTPNENRKVHFVGENKVYLGTAKRVELEKTWAKLKEAANGAWKFFDTKGSTPPDTVTTDYANMELTGLTASATYNVAVEEKPVTSTAVSEKAAGDTPQGGATEGEDSGTITANGDGKVKIKKSWSDKKVNITVPSTTTHLESDAKSLEIKPIYTVMVDNEEQEISTEGRTITVTAKDKDGHTFTGWTATGVPADVDTAQKVITFTMPESDVVLTSTYKTTGVKPNAAADYASMKLTGLTPDAIYTITATDMAAEDITADTAGTIAIKRGWSGKELTIVKKATENETESPAQTLTIKNIYTITIGKEVRLTAEGESVTIKAQIPEGYRFKEWTATGITLADNTLETITFIVETSDITLTPSFTKVLITAPEDLEYDGEGEVSVKLDVPLAEFTGIEVNGKMLVKDQDYTVAEAKGVSTLAASSITVTFTKAYLDTLNSGVQSFKAVLTSGPVEFSIKIAKKPAVAYPDVKQDDWFYDAVMYVSDKEIMSGYADGSFGPADTLGRGQFATILYRMEGSPVVEYNNIFSDVPEGQFYSLPVIWAQSNKVITGYNNGTFGPSDSITREQLATMLYRYADMKGMDVSERANLDSFPDAASVTGFAKETVSWAVAKGIITGDQNRLNPQGQSSRAVAATMIQRFQTKK